MFSYLQAIDFLQKTINNFEKQPLLKEEVEKAQNAITVLKDNQILNLETIGDFFKQGLLVADKNGKIIYVNETNENMFNIKRSEAVNHYITEFTSGNNTPIENAASLQSTLRNESFHAISTIVSSETYTLQYSAPIYQHNELIGYLITDQDISNFLEIKQQLEESETKLLAAKELQEKHIAVVNSIHTLNHCNIPVPSTNKLFNTALKHAFQASQSDVSVLILGETGTGKEIMANYIQTNSHRKNAPFIKINCSAIPPNLLESELFGYAKGAFTGADPKGKIGYFELADKGTILLDEIGELPLEFQAKLLRVIQEKKLTRVGSTTSIDIDIRFILATNRNLKEMVDHGTFRSDLFYRINVFPIRVPPLRERKEDIEELTRFFLSQHNKKYQKHISLGPSVYHNLKNYTWPGNIRELENIIERWVVIFGKYAVIHWTQISNAFYDTGDAYNITDDELLNNLTLSEIMDDYQKEILLWAKAEYKTTRDMAKALGVDHSTIVKKAKRLGISLQET